MTPASSSGQLARTKAHWSWAWWTRRHCEWSVITTNAPAVVGAVLSYLDVKSRKLSLAQRGACTCGRCSCSCSAQLFCPREQCDQTDGEDGERKGPGRVFGAPPSLHGVQDGALVHGHNILRHARRCLGELPVLYRNAVAARRVKRLGSQRCGEGGAIRILPAMQQSV